MSEANQQPSAEDLARRRAIERQFGRSSGSSPFGEIRISQGSRLCNGVIASPPNGSPSTTNGSPSMGQSESTIGSVPETGTESMQEAVPQQTPIPTGVNVTRQEFVKISLKKFQTTRNLKERLIIKSTLKRLYNRS